MDFLNSSVFFGTVLSLLAYFLGIYIKKTIKKNWFNPFLFAVILVIVILLIFKIPYKTFYNSSKYLDFLLTPATVCFAIPLYEKTHILKKNFKAIAIGILTGVITSLSCIWAAAKIFGFTHNEYVTMLPKSVTVAIGMDLSKSLGGYTGITVAVITITGITGSVLCPFLCKIFKIQSSVAKGVGIGSCSHILGTSEAYNLGETEGAVSSLSLVIAGIFTVFAAMLFSNLH